MHDDELRARHPGIQLARLMQRHEVTGVALSRALRISQMRVSKVLATTRAVTADTALRLGHYFRTGPDYWLNLQKNYDLAVASRELLASGLHLDELPQLPPTRVSHAKLRRTRR